MHAVDFPALNLSSVEQKLVDFIRSQAKGRGVVLGLSGGVDSAVIAALSAKALGKEKVLALIMPEQSSSPKADVRDAIGFAKSLGIDHRVIDITPIYDSIMEAIPRSGDRLAEGNVKARLRMALLYYFANLEGKIVVGSGDKSELALGYFTKYGDGGVDILPIGSLYKRQVRLLAEKLGVPRSILKKRSSPCLWRGQQAEEELGLEYDEADTILHLHLDRGYGREKIIETLGKEWEKKVDNVLSRIDANSHKLKMPTVAPIGKG